MDRLRPRLLAGVRNGYDSQLPINSVARPLLFHWIPMQPVTLISFVFFTSLVGLITWWLTRGDRHDTSDGYFLAGRSLTAGFIAGSLMLTNLSTEQLVGLNGAAFADGLCVMAWEVIAAMSLVIMALFFLPRYLRRGIATIPEFLEQRYNQTTRTITSIIFIIAYAGILLPILLYTGATGLMGFLDVSSITGIASDTTNRWIMVWLIGGLGSVYAIFGGLRTVAVSDTLNGFGLLVGGCLILWYGLTAIVPGDPVAALETLKTVHPEKFQSLGNADSSVPFSTLFTGVLLLNLFYWCTNQQIIQRTFGASSLAEGQKGVLAAGGLKVLAPLILVLPGIIALHLFGYISVGTGDSARRVKVIDVVEEFPAIVLESETEKTQILHGTEALTAMKATDFNAASSLVGTTIQFDSKAYKVIRLLDPGTVVTAGEGKALNYHQDIDAKTVLAPRIKDKAYGRLVRRVLPPGFAGFFAAAIVGAILSSFNSALNSTATLFSLGVYQHLINPQADEKTVIRQGKRFGWVVAVFAMTVAPLLAGQDSIFGYLQKMNGLYFIPIFSVVLAGMLSRRVPAVAANLAMVVGFIVIALGYFAPGLQDHVKQLHEYHFLGVVFAGLLGFMLIAGVVAPQVEREPVEGPANFDMTPWPYAIPAGLVLIAIVLSLYVYFAL